MLQKAGFDVGFESRKGCTVSDRVRQFIPNLDFRAMEIGIILFAVRLFTFSNHVESPRVPYGLSTLEEVSKRT